MPNCEVGFAVATKSFRTKLPKLFRYCDIAHSAIALAHGAGWHARIVRDDAQWLVIDTPGGRQSFNRRRDGRTSLRPVYQGEAHGTLPSPAHLVLDAVSSAADRRGGIATVLMPVGSPLAPEANGAIDSVILDTVISRHDDFGDWTVSAATISHTRCWLLSVGLQYQSEVDAIQAMHRMQNCERLLVLPKPVDISDTSVLGEYMRDCGWWDARFPEIVLLSSVVTVRAGHYWLCAWLAATDASVAVAIAESIGALSATDLDPKDRYRLISAQFPTFARRP